MNWITKAQKKVRNLLRWSEQYTRTDMVYLAKGGSWLISGQIVSAVTAFAMALAVANLLPKEIYGTYKYVLSIIGMLGALSLTGLSTTIKQAVARGYEGALREGFAANLRWSIAIFLGGLVGAVYFFLNDNSVLAISILIGATLTPFQQSASLYGAFLVGKKDFQRETIYSIIRSVSSTGLLLIIIFFFDNAVLLVAAYFLGHTITSYVLYRRTLSVHQPNERSEKDTTIVGKHLSIINIFSKASGHLDNILTFHFLGAVELALYSFAVAIPKQVKGVFNHLTTLALPKLSTRSIREINTVFLKRLGLLFVIGGSMAVVYILMAPFIFDILFPKYMDAVLLTQVYAAGIALRLPNALINAVTQSKIEVIPRPWLYWGIFPHLLFIGTLIPLIQGYGVLGVVIAKLIFIASVITVGLIRWFFLTRKSKNGNLR